MHVLVSNVYTFRRTRVRLKELSDLEALETIHDEVVRRFETETDRTDHLDDKSSNIIGFVGIITGLASALGGLSLETPKTLVMAIATGLFFAVLFFLVASFILGLAAYRIRTFTVVPDAYFLIGAYEKKNKEKILRDLNDNYAVAIEDNASLNDQKVTYIKLSIYLLLAGILIIPFFVFLAMLG